MTASTYAANKLLDLVCRSVTWEPPTRVYVSLHTADPGNSGVSEIDTGAWPAYARQDVAKGGSIGDGFDAAESKATSNALEILWDAMDGASPVVITHFGVWDAATGGNLLFSGTLTASKTLGTTDELVLHAGELHVTVS